MIIILNTLFSLYDIALVNAFSKCSNSSFLDLIISKIVFDIFNNEIKKFYLFLSLNKIYLIRLI